ncbi:MAG: class I adenylate-forming enzyme family protein, partial [Acidimicrobiales bacterium]
MTATPDRLALVGRSGRFTFAELDAAVDRVCSGLHHLGVEPGDRVAMSLPNDVDIVIAFLATMRMGAIWLGINRPLAPAEKAYMLRDAEVSVVLTDPSVGSSLEPHRADLPDLRELVIVDAGGPGASWRDLCTGAAPWRREAVIDPLAPAAIAYTSGTTGVPKGAVHTQHNMLLPGRVNAARRTTRAGAVLGVALPLTILNLIVLGPCVAYQGEMTLVAMDRVDGLGMAEWIAAEGITTFSAVPAMVHDLLTNAAVSEEMLASIESI